MAASIKVMIVDDSAVIRQVLRSLLESDPAIEVLAAVPDPVFARQRMAREWPDVLVLDVEMPRMDGLTFLRQLMGERPTPVVMCSTLTAAGTETTMQALAAGAVEVIAKPRVGAREALAESRAQLLRTIHSAARARVGRSGAGPTPARPAPAPRPVSAHVGAAPARRGGVVAIGTSTGGTQALEAVLTVLPAQSPGIVVVQHMPEKFTRAFAERLDGLCAVSVAEGESGMAVEPGRAIIAPGGRHMQLVRRGAGFAVEVKDGPPVNRHRPSVDVLFRSVARHAGAGAMGVIMTGMGDDGAAGLGEMQRAGAYTVAQDEASCVVFGMPREAIRRGNANAVVALSEIAEEITRFGGGEHGHQRQPGLAQ